MSRYWLLHRLGHSCLIVWKLQNVFNSSTSDSAWCCCCTVYATHVPERRVLICSPFKRSRMSTRNRTSWRQGKSGTRTLIDSHVFGVQQRGVSDSGRFEALVLNPTVQTAKLPARMAESSQKNRWTEVPLFVLHYFFIFFCWHWGAQALLLSCGKCKDCRLASLASCLATLWYSKGADDWRGWILLTLREIHLSYFGLLCYCG